MFSESTARSSRSRVFSKNSGAMKNWANRSRAPYNGGTKSLDEDAALVAALPFADGTVSPFLVASTLAPGVAAAVEAVLFGCKPAVAATSK